MGFTRILQSLEELIYELIVWIILYPRTLWLSGTTPLRTLRYARTELEDTPAQQYTATLSPVLFLVISLGITHALGEALAPNTTVLKGMMGKLMSTEQNELITRSVAFAIFPLVYAAQELRRAGQPLDRNTLRAPFYGQCFITGVFALLVGLATTLMELPHSFSRTGGAALAAATVIWYVAVQSRWLTERFGVTLATGLGLAAYGFVKATAIVVIAVAALSAIP
jgi:hypothetical protein